ncbi:Bromodomain-domain-containing protein [Piromyces finnis]|uniref:Bromodomain-domain-containing protein n=1 Tax=Piromyces finnis TaxID=1754191 RepID=A0A1Y1VG26_9FUNG|nr:Bromodomain-domain-containing protein [Piromyces finnis]|eukprot:ORX54789.1 Bromodomain-domain-containing protein [Piromyces finnis]
MKKRNNNDRESIIAYEKNIINTLINLKEKSGRKISELFIELPSKEHYPDYYNIIKNPISISIINNKIKRGEYPTLDDLCNDIKLMQDNANTYNKKNSIICKDAALLMKTFERMRDEFNSKLKEELNNELPLNVEDVKSLLKLIKNYKNSNGKYIADSFREIPSEDKFPEYYNDVEEKDMLSIKIIRKKLNQNNYSSFKEFRKDFETMCNDIINYRKKKEPEIEKEGKELLKYFSEISKLKLAKIDGKDENANSNKKHIKSIIHNSETIQIGDFVHIVNENDSRYPLILQIFDMWIDEDNKTKINGIWFLIPEQTVYPASKRFLENEVFRTTHNETYSLDKIIDKCYVLNLKDYCRGFPKGSENKKVYVCESRYIETAKTTTKIKNWSISMPSGYKELEDSDLILHKNPLTIKRFVLITPENSDIPIRVPYTPEGNITLKRGAGGLDLSKFDTSILEDANKNNINDLTKSQVQTPILTNDIQSLDRKRLNPINDINSPYKRKATPERVLYPNNMSNSSTSQKSSLNTKIHFNNNQSIQQNRNIANNPHQNSKSNNNMIIPLNQMNYPYPNQQDYLNYPSSNNINTSNQMNNTNIYTNANRKNNTNNTSDYKSNIEDIKKKLKHSLYLSSPPNNEIAEQLKLYHSDKYIEFIKNKKEKTFSKSLDDDINKKKKESKIDIKYLLKAVKGLTELWNNEAKVFKSKISV